MAASKTVFAVLSVALLVTFASAKRCSGPFCLNHDDCQLGQVTCKDCHSRLLCTPLGALSLPCWIPGLQHCSEGRCVRQPSPQCQPSNLTTTEEPSTTEELTSTLVPSTTEKPSITQQPSTSEDPSTTEIPVTTKEPSTTPEPDTSVELSTTEVPAATE